MGNKANKNDRMWAEQNSEISLNTHNNDVKTFEVLSKEEERLDTQSS